VKEDGTITTEMEEIKQRMRWKPDMRIEMRSGEEGRKEGREER
jgi:hypothetical protein